MKLRGLFPNSYNLVSAERFIYSQDRSAYLEQKNRQTDPGNKSLTNTWMWKLGDRLLSFCFGNKEAAQFHFYEYINRNPIFILDSHRPFICSVIYMVWPRDYWMIYKRPGFLAVVWFGSSPPSPPLPPSVSSIGDTKEDWERETTWWREREEGGRRGAESYNRKKALMYDGAPCSLGMKRICKGW
jgi:hypothetical protein